MADQGLALLAGWLRPVVILLVVVGIAEMMIPHGALRRYVDLFLGLLVLAALLNPLVAGLGGDLLSHAGVAEKLPIPDLTAGPVEQLSTPWPSLTKGRGPGPAAGLVREVYKSQLEREVERLLATLPDIAAAQAEVTLAPDPAEGEAGLDRGPPPVTAVYLRLQLAAPVAGQTDSATQGVHTLLAQHFHWSSSLITIDWRANFFERGE